MEEQLRFESYASSTAALELVLYVSLQSADMAAVERNDEGSGGRHSLY